VLVSGGYGDPIAAVVTEVAGERLTYRLDDGREQRGHLDDVARVLAAVGADSAPLRRRSQPPPAPRWPDEGNQRVPVAQDADRILKEPILMAAQHAERVPQRRGPGQQNEELQPVVWEDPPPIDRRRAGKPRSTIWLRRLAPLLEQPGSWAKVHTFNNKRTAQATVSRLRKGVYRMPTGSWSFTSRAAAVYARFNGRSTT